LDGPLPKLCLVIPTSNQDGRQAKNRKRGDEILIVHCCFSISQNEFKIPPFSIFSLAAILVGSWDHQTQFWKGAIQGPFHQNLVAKLKIEKGGMKF
jgi:hypothetical protein